MSFPIAYRTQTLGVPKSLKDPHITRVLGTPGPHIPSDMGPPRPHITRDMGTGVPKLGGPHFTQTPVFSYVQCLKAAGAKTRVELEEMWKGCYHDEEVRECVEEFLSLEESIQELFDDIDVEVQKAEDQLAIQNVTKVGDQLPADLSLTECRSERWSNLRMFGSSPSSHSLYLSSFIFDLHETSTWRV